MNRTAAALLVVLAMAVPVRAEHSWGTYHWARTTTSFDLRVVGQRQSRTGTHVRFQQTLNGIPVFGAGVTVSIPNVAPQKVRCSARLTRPPSASAENFRVISSTSSKSSATCTLLCADSSD